MNALEFICHLDQAGRASETVVKPGWSAPMVTSAGSMVALAMRDPVGLLELGRHLGEYVLDAVVETRLKISASPPTRSQPPETQPIVRNFNYIVSLERYCIHDSVNNSNASGPSLRL
jgi:hypothetical protein